MLCQQPNSRLMPQNSPNTSLYSQFVPQLVMIWNRIQPDFLLPNKIDMNQLVDFPPEHLLSPCNSKSLITLSVSPIAATNSLFAHVAVRCFLSWRIIPLRQQSPCFLRSWSTLSSTHVFFHSPFQLSWPSTLQSPWSFCTHAEVANTVPSQAEKNKSV